MALLAKNRLYPSASIPCYKVLRRYTDPYGHSTYYSVRSNDNGAPSAEYPKGKTIINHGHWNEPTTEEFNKLQRCRIFDSGMFHSFKTKEDAEKWATLCGFRNFVGGRRSLFSKGWSYVLCKMSIPTITEAVYAGEHHIRNVHHTERIAGYCSRRIKLVKEIKEL